MTGRTTITLSGGLIALALGIAAFGPVAAAQSRLDRLIDACRTYANDAVRMNRINLRRNCGLRGTRWSSNPIVHFRWCISAPPPVRRREARARADQLRNCRRPTFCTQEYRPVCGIRGGERRTYSNACVARRAGARIIAQGRCRGVNPGPGPGPGGGRFCRLRDARITVSTRNCSPKSLRIPFGRRVLRNGESVVKTVNSGTIGRGFQPWGVCNFHTRIRYVCRNGRLRIQRVFVCQQARSNRTAANCRVSN